MPWDDGTIRDFASQFVRDEVFGSDKLPVLCVSFLRFEEGSMRAKELAPPKWGASLFLLRHLIWLSLPKSPSARTLGAGGRIV